MSKKWLISVMATAMVFTLGLGAGCFNVNKPSNSNSSSEAPVDSSSTTGPSISLSQETGRISVYETLQLTATTANGEGDVEWTSSAPAVATVDATGLVTGVSEGLVTITATYAGKTATCQITVTTSTEAPVMTVSTTNVSLNKDDTYTVTVSTTWKGNEVENVQYSWFLEDETMDWSTVAEVEVSDDTKSATFKGLGAGTEKFVVYARVNGQDLMQTITVKVVDNSITFAVSNLNKGAEAYEANLSLAAGEGLVQSIKPEVAVYYKQQLQSDLTLTYQNSNPEVATMAEDGTITVLKEGVATFTAEVTVSGSTATLYIRVNAYRPEFNIGNVTVETGRATKTLSLGDVTVQGTVNSVKLSNEEVLSSYEEGVITLDGAKLPVKTADLGEGKALVVETEKAKYVASADVYTLVIRNKEDFALIGDASYAADDNVWLWGGYIVLGGDIDMENTSYEASFNYQDMKAIAEAGNDKNNGDGYTDARYHGFHGIFDGKGYQIKNLNQGHWFGGLFPVFGGTFRNVAFTNLTVNGQASPICDEGAGTIENVYMQVSAVNGANNNLFCQANSFGSFRINNCFVDLPESVTNFTLGKAHNGYKVVNGVYVVGASVDFARLSPGNPSDFVWGSYNSYADLLANVDFSAWAGDFWTLVNGIPVPSGVEEAGNLTYTAESLVGVGNELKVSGKYVQVQISAEAMAAGITLNGNTIVIPEDTTLTGRTFEARICNLFDNEDYESFTFTILDTENYVIEGEAQKVNLNSTATTFDFSSVAANIQGTLSSVKVNGTAVEGATYENGTLTVDLTKAGNVYGAGTIVAEFIIVENEEITAVEKVSASIYSVREIATAEQFAALESYMQMNGVSAYAELYVTANIDMKGATVTGVGTFTSTWTHQFAGTFDGQGFTISNFTLASTNRAALFSQTTKAAVIKNVGLYNVTVSGNAGLVAVENNGTIKNVFVYGAISAGEWYAPASLLVSKNQGTIESCVVVCDNNVATAGQERGMLAGWSTGTVKDSVAINLSGSTLYGVNVRGASDNTDPVQSEQAGSVNIVAQGYDDYVTKAAAVTYDDWATAYIQQVIDANKNASVGMTEMTLGSEQQITANAKYVKSYALAAAVSGVEVSNTGLITVAADAAGKTTFTVVVTYIDGTTANLNLSTTMKSEAVELGSTDIDAREAETISFDFTGYGVTADQFRGISINGQAVEGTNIAIDGLKVSFPAELLAIGENTVVYECHTADTVILASYKVIKASMIIDTVDEWKNLSTTMTVDNLITADKSYGGYYILAADIDMKGETFNCLWNWSEARTWDSRAGGFMGTIDGRGHYVANMKTGSFGLFGIMNTAAVLKNIAFVNLDMNAAGSLLGSMSNGTVENVYIDLVAARCGSHPNGFGLGNPNKEAYGEYHWKNAFINVQSVTADHHNSEAGYGYVLGTAHNGYNAFTNVLMVSNGASVYNALSTDNPAYGVGQLNVYQTKAEMASASDWSIEDWGDYWTLDNDGLPIFKSICKVEITNVATEATAGSTYQVNVAAGAAVNYTVDNDKCSIDANGLLTIGADVAEGTIVTVTATNVKNSNSKDTIALTILAPAVVVEGVNLVGMKDVNGDVATFDVALPEGYEDYTTVVSAVYNGTSDITANVVANAGVVTFKTADVNANYGAEKLITVKLSNGTLSAVFEITVKAATMVINNTADLNYFSTLATANATGYYLLGGNVEYTGTYTNTCRDDANPFKGTFDGQGYVINNFTTSTGFVPAYGNYGATGAELKNVSFTNAKTTVEGGTILFGRHGCRIENVYISVAEDTAANTYIWANNYGAAKVYNMVIEYLGGDGTDYVFAQANRKYGLNGIYAVGVQTTLWKAVAGTGTGADDVAVGYATWADLAAANIDFSGWNTNFWTVANGMIKPKNLTVALPNTDDDVVLAGNSYTFFSYAPYVKAEVSAVEGVSVNGNVISVAESVAHGTTITITYTNVWTNETATKTLSVEKNTVVTLDQTTDFDLRKASVSVAAQGMATLTSAPNGVTLADGNIVIANSALGQGKNDWGNQTVTVVGKDENGGNLTVNVPVFAYVSISTHAQLFGMANLAYKEGVSHYGYFKLTADIYATGDAWYGNGSWGSDWNFVLEGTFDGDGYSIIDRQPATAGNRGLFCCVGASGVVKNIGFVNTTSSDSGVIAVENRGLVENVFVEGAIKVASLHYSPAALLVSKNGGTIRNCMVIATSALDKSASTYGGLIAGQGAANVENNVVVDLTGKAWNLVSTSNVATATAGETANTTTNVRYTSMDAFLGVMADDYWAKSYLENAAASYLRITGATAVMKGGDAAQYSVKSDKYGCTWSLQEGEVAGVSIVDGLLTVTEEATASSVTVVATNEFGISAEYSVIIVSEKVTDSVTMDYDAREANFSFDVSKYSAEELSLVKAMVGGNEVEATLEEGKVLIAGDKFVLGPTVNNAVIAVMDTAKVYEISLAVTKATMVISNADELDLLGEVSYAAESAFNKWGGYFVLDSDIEYNRKFAAITSYADIEAKFMANIGATSWTDTEKKALYGDNTRDARYNGFHGTIDGRGHIIDGFSVNHWSGGMFVFFGGTIQNIAFTNVSLPGNTGLFCINNGGTIKNIYVEVTSVAANTSDIGSVLTGTGAYGVTRIFDCVVDVSAVSAAFNVAETAEAKTNYAVGKVHCGYNTLQGVYAIGTTQMYVKISGNEGVNDVYAGYADRAAMIAATDWQAEVDTWDTNFWTEDADGLPIPVAVKNAQAQA